MSRVDHRCPVLGPPILPDDGDPMFTETYKFLWFEPEETLRLLQREEHGINTTNDLGWTTLMWAVLEGEGPLVDALLKAGANVFIESTKEWQPAGGDIFPARLTALDLCHIAMKRGYYDINSGENHLAILRKLNPLFKVAEAQAMQDYSNVDPNTFAVNHARLPMQGYQSVLHVTEARYRDRDYSATFTRAADPGLRLTIRQQRVVIDYLVAGSEAGLLAEREESDFVSGGYVHPRAPYLRPGLAVSRINGLDIGDYGDVLLVQMLAIGFGLDEATAGLTASRSEVDPADANSATRALTAAMAHLTAQGTAPTRPVTIDFIDLAAPEISGWMEGADALRAMDPSYGGDAELGLAFSAVTAEELGLEPLPGAPPASAKAFFAAGELFLRVPHRCVFRRCPLFCSSWSSKKCSRSSLFSAQELFHSK